MTNEHEHLLHLIEAAQRAGRSEDEIREIVEATLDEDAELEAAA